MNKTAYLRLVAAFIFCAYFLFPSSGFAQSMADRIVGYYYYYEPKEKEYSQVEVYKSGDKYKGKVVWLKEPLQADGKPKVDKYNKDELMRERPIIGISIFDGLAYDKGENRWKGEIYDPANGSSFCCIAWFADDGSLKIKGYVGAEWMGINRTITWTKEEHRR